MIECLKALWLKKPVWLSWSVFLYVLGFICLLNVTIYPDEQAYWIQLFRGHRDGWLINNFLPMCQSFWTTKVPISWIPGRELLYYINGQIERPIYFRIFGVGYFLILIFLYRLFEIKLIPENKKRQSYLNILFLGLIPVSLVYLRPETLMLICIMSAILIYESKQTGELSTCLKIFSVVLLFSLEVNLHGRAIFMAPIYLYILVSLGLRSKSKFPLLLALVGFGWCFYESVDVYKHLYACPEDRSVEEILNSLRFDPDIANGGLKALATAVLAKHAEIYNIVKGAVFINPDGAFPLTHKNFPPILLDVFGFVKTILVALAGATVVGLAILIFKFKKLNSAARSRLFLIVSIAIFLYLDVVLMKTDRFYESAIFWPLVIVVFIYQLSIYKSIDGFLYDWMNRFGIQAIWICFYTMALVFVVLYGKELAIKGGETYVSIRRHDSDEYKNAVYKAAAASGINIKESRLLVGDFHTIHYTAEGHFPLMINLFWWFSDKSTSNYIADYGKLKLLRDLGSAGLVVRCDSLPPGLRDEASISIIEQDKADSPDNQLCVISGNQLNNIDFEGKLLRQ